MVLLLASITQLQGQSLDLLCEQVGAENYQTRAKAVKTLFERALINRDIIVRKVVALNEATPDPEIRFGAERLLRKIYNRYELGIGGSDFGFELGWFITHNGEQVSSFPLVLEIDEEGAAAKAGMNPGDVIVRMNGKWLASVDSRNELVRQLSQVKAGTPVEFQTKFNQVKKPFARFHKTKNATVKVVPISPEETTQSNKKNFDKDAYENWLRRMSS